MKWRDIMTSDYLDWVRQAKLPPLTGTQAEFAEWLLKEDNAKVISQIGDLGVVFESVRWYLKQTK